MADARNTVIATAFAPALLAVLAGSMVNAGLPAIGCSLAVDGVLLPRVVGVYLAAVGFMLPAGGALGDRLGRRRCIAAGTALLAIGSAACASASSFEFLLAGRLFQGLATALILPNAVALIATASPDSRLLPGYSATCTAVTGLGPVIGGLSAGCGGWRWSFAAVAIVAVLLAVVRRPATAAFEHGEARRGKIGDCGTAGAALSPKMLTLLHLYAACFFGAFFGLLVLVPAILARTGGYGAAASASVLLPLCLLTVLLSPVAGWAQRALGTSPVLLVAAITLAAALLALGGIARGEPYALAALLPLCLAAVGVACASAPLSAAVLACAPPGQAGQAAGLNSAAARLGGALATWLLSPAFAPGTGAGGLRTAIGVELAFVTIAALCALTLVARSPRECGTPITTTGRTIA